MINSFIKCKINYISIFIRVRDSRGKTSEVKVYAREEVLQRIARPRVPERARPNYCFIE